MREGDRIVVDVSRRLPSTGETFVLWDGNGLVVKQVEAVRGGGAARRKRSGSGCSPPTRTTPPTRASPRMYTSSARCYGW